MAWIKLTAEGVGGIVKAVVAPGVADTFSRKILSDYEEYVKTYFKAKGMAWIKLTAEGVNSPIAKFFSEEEMKAIIERTGAKTGDVIIIVADKPKVVYASLGAVRLRLGKELHLYNKDEFKFLWVVHFPMFEYDEENKRWKAMHHPFTAPRDEDVQYLTTDPGRVKAKAYDMVLNGKQKEWLG